MKTNKFLIIFIFLLTSFILDARSKTDKVSDRILVQFAKQMQTSQLSAVGMGGGCTRDEKINLISTTFLYNEVMSIETARVLIVNCIDELLKIIHSHQESAAYFESFPPPLSILFLGIIGQEPNRQMDYIKNVSIIEGKIYYSTDDPEGKIMPYIHVLEETFDEAKEIVNQQAKKETISSTTTSLTKNLANHSSK